MNNNISLFVTSCDSYNYLWKEFAILFDRYWDKNITIDKYIVTESQTDNTIENFRWHTAGNISWSDRVLSFLNSIDSKYVIWLLDDYFLRKKITKEKFDYYLKFIEENDVDRLGIHEHSWYYSIKYKQDKIFKYNQNSEYTASTQASIWNRKFLLDILRNNESVWEFEIKGSKRANNIIHNIYFEAQDIPWYLEAVKGGRLTDNYLKIKQEENFSYEK